MIRIIHAHDASDALQTSPFEQYLTQYCATLTKGQHNKFDLDQQIQGVLGCHDFSAARAHLVGSGTFLPGLLLPQQHAVLLYQKEPV